MAEPIKYRAAEQAHHIATKKLARLEKVAAEAAQQKGKGDE